MPVFPRSKSNQTSAARIAALRPGLEGRLLVLSLLVLLALWLIGAAPVSAGTRVNVAPFKSPFNDALYLNCENFFTVQNQGRIPNRFLKRGFGICRFTIVGLIFVLVETDEQSACPVKDGIVPRKWGPTNDQAFYCEYIIITRCPEGYRGIGLGYCVARPGNAPQKQPPLCEISGDSGQPVAGNPINLATQSKYQREEDYRSAGPFPLTMIRHYNSREGIRETSLGPAWRHIYDRSIEVNFGGSVRTAYVFRDDGREYYFTQDLATGEWVADSDIAARLTEEIGAGGETVGWTYTTESDFKERYDAGGRLVSIVSREGFAQTLGYDSAGRLSTVTDPFGRELGFAYDTENRLSSMTDPASAVYHYLYDSSGRLEKLVFPDETPLDDSDNPAREYLYENSLFPNALTGIINADGGNGDRRRFATWTYNDQGRAISSERGNGANRIDVTYNPDGSVTVTDARNTSRTYQIDVVLGVAKSAGVSEPCDDCRSRSREATFDTNGYPASSTDFNGNLTTFQYDERGLEISRTEAVGTADERTVTTEWHPSLRRPARIMEPGRETLFTYDSVGRLLTRTVTDLTTTPPLSRTTTRTYTDGSGIAPVGLLKTIDGPRPGLLDLTVFEYDGSGNLTATTNALDQQTNVMDYNAHGQPLTIVDPNGATTILEYDVRRRLIRREVAGSVTRFEYDHIGNVTRVTLPDNSFLDQQYDDANRLVSLTDNLGHRVAYTLDAFGNRTFEQTVDSTGLPTREMSRRYSALNRLIEEEGADNQITEFEYDDQGNVREVIDPNRQSTASNYDALNRLVETIAPDYGITRFEYDGRDNLVAVIDPRELRTDFTYNGFDEVIETFSPDTGRTTQSYDEAGNRVISIDARGIKATFTYDALNRLTGIEYPDPSENVSFEYDQGPNGIGRLTRISDPAGTIDMAYDARGNLTSETRTVDGVPYTIGYAYDFADRLVEMTYPSGLVVSYARDVLGRVSEVTALKDGVLRVVASGLDYAPFGPLTKLTFGNGIQLIRTLDKDYRLATQRAEPVQGLVYEYDPASNILGIQDLLHPGQSQSFGYDSVNRLASAQGIYGTRAYTYDGVGNRLTRTANGGTDDYAYSLTANQLDAVTGPNAETFVYDAVGNTVQKGPASYIYNDANRFESVQTSGELVAQYTYNAKGERVKKVVAGETTLFHYDQAGNLLSEYDGEGDPLRDYIWLEGERLAIVAGGPDITFRGTNRRTGDELTVGLFLEDQVVEIEDRHGLAGSYALAGKQWKLGERGVLKLSFKGRGIHFEGNLHLDTLKGTFGGRAGGPWYPYKVTGEEGGASPEGLFFIHTDHLGTPKVITDESQKVVWEASHTPFGTALIAVNELENNLRFPGQYFDAETTLHYNYARDYDSRIGRFTQSDPIGLAGGANTYLYALTNPIVNTDPTGLVTFRWRTCNAQEIDACKTFCSEVIGRPYVSCRARVGFRVNINTIDYYNLPTGLSCNCEDEPDEESGQCGENCQKVLTTTAIGAGAGLLTFVIVKKCVGAGLLFTPAAPLGAALLASP